MARINTTSGVKKRNSKTGKSLSHGRPPTFRQRISSIASGSKTSAAGAATTPGAAAVGKLSSKATRTIIRTHHTLEKRRAAALAKGDEVAAKALQAQIEAQGGLELYQLASLTGQGAERGGDSSKILMDWIKNVVRLPGKNAKARETEDEGNKLRLLEVGALSTTNACSRSGVFDVTRIDLNSQAPGITKQDFMERPLPTGEGERFDIISLSLVVNYVPDPVGRGAMLERTLQFLQRRDFADELEGKHDDEKNNADGESLRDFFPSLFLVLPAPCVLNSRYLDQDRLDAIMLSLGYNKKCTKVTNKLVYYLYVWTAAHGRARKKGTFFKKTELRPGGQRNNFAIVLK